MGTRSRKRLETLSFKPFSQLFGENRSPAQIPHTKTHNSENTAHKSIDAPRKERVYLMANIREKQKDGKIFSFSFTACLERDAQGKQVRRYTTWIPPEGLTPSRARKAAERAADAWENEIKAEYYF